MSAFRSEILILKSFMVTILLILCTITNCNAEDWPWFLGLNRNATSNETGLMKSWPQSGPEIMWTTKLGIGFGGVAVHSGEVYILDRVKGKKDVLRCLSLANGQEQWRFAYDAPGRISYPGSRSHPAVDEKHIFILGPFGDFHCISKETHKPVWKKNIIKDFGGRTPHWAMSQSPAIYKDKVIVAPATRSVGMVAYDRKSGEILWKSQRFDGDLAYTSCMVSTIESVDQILYATTKQTVGVDANNGRILWRNNDWSCRIPTTSPMLIGKDRVLIVGGYGAGAAMFHIQKMNGRFTSTTLFKTPECNCQVHQPLLYEGDLYINGNDKTFRKGMMCMDLEGNVKWETGRNPGFEFGGLLLADGMIYIVDGTKGDLCLVKPDPSGYREISRVNLLSGRYIWATLALVDGKLLLRDQTKLRCVDVKAK
jgi:outer membrane protein assembly factor BamB